MKKTILGRINFRYDPPQTGTTFVIWRIGVLLSITGIVIMLICCSFLIVDLVKFGSGGELQRRAEWLLQFAQGFMMIGSETSLVAYLVSIIQKNTETNLGFINIKRMWLIAVTMAVLSAPFIALCANTWLIVIPIFFGAILVAIFEIGDKIKTKQVEE